MQTWGITVKGPLYSVVVSANVSSALLFTENLFRNIVDGAVRFTVLCDLLIPYFQVYAFEILSVAVGNYWPILPNQGASVYPLYIKFS